MKFTHSLPDESQRPETPPQYRELERLNRLYVALSHVNQAIVRSPTREELFRKICAVLVGSGGFRMAWIGWHAPESRRILPVAECGDENGYLQSIEIYSDERPQGRGPTGTAFREGRPYICNDLLNDPATVPFRAEAERRGFRASAVFPIHLKGDGALSVYAVETGFFQDKEIALLTEAASDVSFALDNFAREEERHRAEAVAEHERHFSITMIESMPGIVYFYDEQGRFLRWNRNFETVSGYSSAEIAQMHPLDFFAGDDKPLLEQRIAEAFAKGESSVEAAFVAKDGRTTRYFFTGKRLLFDGQPCLVGMGIDVTERQQAEAEVRRLNAELERRVIERTAQLEAANKELEAFSYSVSHDLRAPLRAVSGFATMVIEDYGALLPEEGQRYLERIRKGGKRMGELIDDLLAFSRFSRQPLDRREVDTAQLVKNVISDLLPQHPGRAIEIRVDDLPPCYGDPALLRQVWVNLLSNAMKYTRGREPAVIGISGRMEQGENVWFVRDNGTGFDMRYAHKLFGVFQRLHRTDQFEGTGVGLAIVQRIVQRHGGRVWAEAQVDRGATFSFTLEVEPKP